jgi:hypothetical protein
MAVEHIDGGSVECAWIEAGIRQTGRFPVTSLEVVSALDCDDAKWREAFRAGTNRKIG